MPAAADRNRQKFSARTGSGMEEREENQRRGSAGHQRLTRALDWARGGRCDCRGSANHRQRSNVSHQADLLTQGDHVISSN